jgi:hypothetical protein
MGCLAFLAKVMTWILVIWILVYLYFLCIQKVGLWLHATLRQLSW